MKREKKHATRVFALIAAVVIPLLVGGLSAFLTAEDMKIYETIHHPPLAPPGWLFPIAWTVLYVLMGIASYLVYTADTEPAGRRKALSFYAAQLAMNFVWSTLFFTYGQYLLSLIWLLVMWVLVAICVILFSRIRKSAGLMMGVLLVWTTFAAYLNLAYYVMSITPMPIAA